MMGGVAVVSGERSDVASILSMLAVRDLRGGEGLPKKICNVESGFGHLRSLSLIACSPSLQRGHSGYVEESRRFAQRCARRTASAWLLIILQPLDEKKYHPPPLLAHLLVVGRRVFGG